MGRCRLAGSAWTQLQAPTQVQQASRVSLRRSTVHSQLVLVLRLRPYPLLDRLLPPPHLTPPLTVSRVQHYLHPPARSSMHRSQALSPHQQSSSSRRVCSRSPQRARQTLVMWLRLMCQQVTSLPQVPLPLPLPLPLLQPAVAG